MPYHSTVTARRTRRPRHAATPARPLPGRLGPRPGLGIVTVTGVGRRAKYLLADLASGGVLLMHLGMSGSFRVSQGDGKAGAGVAESAVI